MNSTSKKNITIALSVEDSIYLSGLCDVIGTFEGFQIVTTTNRLSDLLEHINAVTEMPDVLLTDSNIHQERTIEEVKMIKGYWKDIKVLMMSGYDHPYNIIKAFQSEGNGHISWDCESQELHRALLSVHYTGQYYNETVLNHTSPLLQHLKSQWALITEQELRLLTLICTEMSYKEIADQLGLNLQIVEGYRDILFSKLNVSSRVALAVTAHKMGILNISDNDAI